MCSICFSWRISQIQPIRLCMQSVKSQNEQGGSAAASHLCGGAAGNVTPQSHAPYWSPVGGAAPGVTLLRVSCRTHRTSEGSMTFTLQPPSPDTSSWQAIPDFSPLSPDVLSAPPTPTSRDTPRLISEETQSSVSDSGCEEMVSEQN